MNGDPRARRAQPLAAVMPRTPRRAVSIVEMVIVVLVCALMAGIAMPRIGAASNRYRADYAARRVVADLDRARANARLTGVSQTVTFDVTNNRYTVSGSGTGLSAGFVVNLSDDPHAATLVSADMGGGSLAVTFDAYGQPRPVADGSIVVRCGTDARTVTLSGGAGKATWK